MDGPALVKLVKNNKKQSQIKLPQILVGSFLPMDLHYHSDNASLGRLPPSFSLSSTLCIQGLFIPTASDVVSGIGPSKPCLVVKITPTLLPVVASTCAVHIKVKRTGLVICSSRQLNFWLMSDFKMGFARCSLASGRHAFSRQNHFRVAVAVSEDYLHQPHLLANPIFCLRGEWSTKRSVTS